MLATSSATSETPSADVSVHLPIAGDEFFAGGHGRRRFERAGSGTQEIRRRQCGTIPEFLISRLIFEERHTREDLALEEFEEGAAAGGAVGDLVGHFEFLGGRGGVAAADDRGGAVGGGFGDGCGHGLGGAGELLEFKHAGRSVPDDGLGAEDGLAVEFDGLRAGIEAAPTVRNARGEIRRACVFASGEKASEQMKSIGKINSTLRAAALVTSSSTILAPSAS